MIDKIICVNDTYDSKALQHFMKHDVQFPVKGLPVPYTLREIRYNEKTGDISITVNEIVNQPINGIEPAFHYSRFSYDNQPDNVLTYEELRQQYRDRIQWQADNIAPNDDFTLPG
jgi:hypothetical protein